MGDIYMQNKRGNHSKRTKTQGQEPQVRRVRTPKKNEIIGSVVSLLGSGRMLVACKDGKERVCRIPGRIRKRMWIKEGDIVLVQPWEISGDKRGDVVWRYSPIDVGWLKKKGYL